MEVIYTMIIMLAFIVIHIALWAFTMYYVMFKMLLDKFKSKFKNPKRRRKINEL